MLIVANRPATLREIAMHFHAVGWETSKAPDIKRAIEIAIATQPNVIVTELALPDARGYQFVRSLRSAVDNDVVVVWLTTPKNATTPEATRASFDSPAR
jgi:DNA-binding response OmpR family regulator